MNVETYQIYRKTTGQVRNDWGEILFEAGQVTQAIFDVGPCWLARPINTDATPRMLPKNECRLLSEEEKRVLGLPI